MIWSDAQIATLRAEWSRGLPSAHIGKSIGVSAEAVRAKRRQLNLPARDAYKARGISAAKASPISDKLGPLPGSTPRPWLTRAFGECAFPVDGDGAETRSCCLPVARGSYCFTHVRIMRG
jgi:hypothetical protein